jgi:polar amino acid transport system ATP-binding protein
VSAPSGAATPGATDAGSLANGRGVDVSVTDLRKQFGDRTILDGLTFSIPAGATVALIGPSGGGKSTFLRCLNGLTPFDAGQVQVGPHALRAGPIAGANRAAAQRVRRLLGMIFQDFQLFPHLTAVQNIVEAPRRVLGAAPDEARARALSLLERVGLADRADAYPRQLSGGQKQRVAIARALAMSPRGLLCDEITSALDPELKGEVLGVLEGLRREGITLVVVTHEIGFARRAADRVLVLERGAIIEDGPPSEVLDHPKTARTRQFLSRILV